MISYAGIGSRETPVDVLGRMTGLAKDFALQGFWLRTGGARGADQAFEQGARVLNNQVTVFKPSDNIPQEAYQLAKQYHPAWHKCDDYARRCHARNALILLGEDLNDPVDFVVCWTPATKLSAGTGQALRIAFDRMIPDFNLWFDDDLYKLKSFVESLVRMKARQCYATGG